MTTSTPLPLHADETRASWYRLLLVVALIAATVSLLTTSLIITDFLHDRNESPLTAANIVARDPAAPRHVTPLLAELNTLHTHLAADPENETLKKQIRDIDLTLRQTHFQRRARIVHNAYILLASLALLVISLKASTQVAKNPPGMMAIFPPPQDFWKAASTARLPILAMSLLLVAGLVAAAFATPRLTFLTNLNNTAEKNTTTQGNPATGANPTDPGATLPDLLANWPSWRGPTGSGISTDPNPPTSWDAPNHKNILWTSPVPLPGNNSPIVWQNHVFLSGADASSQVVYCYDADSGKLLWQTPITGLIPGSSLSLNDDTSFAPSTLATDGKRVYAIFPTMDLVALDLNGKELWSKNLGKADNMYGHASSLAICQGRLIIQFDQGEAPEKKKSALLALDGATGNELWKTPRAVASSWTSPIVIYPDSGPQIITASKPLVAAFDPATGKELYSANVLEDGEVAPSPVFSNGRIFAVANQFVALPTTSHGDITKSLLWTASDNLPDIVSPLVTPEIVALVNGLGHVTACNPATGKVLWEHDIEGKFHASPVLANKHIYLTDRAGITHIFDSAPAYHELPPCPLGQDVSASPAFLHNRIYIRAKSNLFCIGTK